MRNRVQKACQVRIKASARNIAQGAPRLADLGEEQLARVVVTETLKDELRQAADLEKIRDGEEREPYLSRAGRSASNTPGLAVAPNPREQVNDWQAWAFAEITASLVPDHPRLQVFWPNSRL